jgi:hypothetical protein
MERCVKTKVLLGVMVSVVVWTVFVHALRSSNLVLAAPLYPGLMVSLLVTGGHGGTLMQDKIAFVAELGTNLLAYGLVATVILRIARISN